MIPTRAVNRLWRVEESDKRSLRVSLAGHFEVFYSFTLSSPAGVSVEHVTLAYITHKAFLSMSLKLLVTFQSRVWEQKLTSGDRRNQRFEATQVQTHPLGRVSKAQAAHSSGFKAKRSERSLSPTVFLLWNEGNVSGDMMDVIWKLDGLHLCWGTFQADDSGFYNPVPISDGFPRPWVGRTLLCCCSGTARQLEELRSSLFHPLPYS